MLQSLAVKSKISFTSRDEAIDFGKDYEYLMAAYYGLTLTFNDEVKDFKISSNNNDFGAFDDVVIECSMANGEEHVFALQLKHVNRRIAQVTLIRKSKKKNSDKFYLKKYAEEFQKVKTMFAKENSYNAPFQNVHFILITNSPLEKCEDVSEVWKKLEPVADGKIIESGLCIRKIENFLGKNLLMVPQTTDEFLYAFKPVEDNSPDTDFFQQFAFFTKQKDAKEMEALIAEIILKKFKNCEPKVAVSYLNFFNYWCRRDYGSFKVTKEDVRMKLAELILTPYIPDPDMKNMRDCSDDKKRVLDIIFLLFDIVIIDNQFDNELINKVWESILREFRTVTDQWSTPRPGKYAANIVKGFPMPVSAFNENFNEASVKTIYIMLWHAGIFPLVLKIGKSSTSKEHILSGIQLCENLGKKKNFFLINENECITPSTPKWTIFRNLSDLTTDMGSIYPLVQDKLFVSVQGRPAVALDNLIEIEKGLLKSITMNEVVRMLDDNFVVGNNYMEHFPKNYIKREIPKVVLNVNVINELVDEVFVVSYTDSINSCNLKVMPIDFDKYLLLKHLSSNTSYLPKQIKLTDIKRKQDDKHNRFCICVNGYCTKEQLEDIYSTIEEKNCHHVRYIDEERIEWIESRFHVNNIDKYVLGHKTFKSEDFLEDQNVLSYFKNKINVLCAEPGMGKSIVMKYMALTYPSDHWVVMISLGEHANFFKQGRDINEVLGHFLKIPEQIPFVSNLISVLSTKKQMLFLWDGFDELPGECVEVVITIIKHLAIEGYPQWVAARTDSKKLLQDKFTVLALVLPEFTQQNKYDYVYCHLKEKYQDDMKVQEIIDEVNKNITVSLNCEEFDYAGVPLQIHMVVDIYLRKPSTVAHSEFITLIDIYKKFIEGKFDSLFEKAEADLDNLHMQEIRAQYIASQLALYEKAAVKSCMDDRFLVNLDLEYEELVEELEKGIDSLGLITSISKEKKVIFAHKTYEEFLVASWLVKHCHTHQDLVKNLFEEKYNNIRLIFDMLLARDSPIHLAVLYRNIDLIKQHKKDIAICKDKGGRNVLHVACSWGRRHPLVEEIESDDTIKPVEMSDDELINRYRSIVAYGLKHCSLPAFSSLKEMLKLNSNPDGVVNQMAISFTKSYQAEGDRTTPASTTILNPNVFGTLDPEDEAYLEILEFLMEHQCNVFEEDSLHGWNVVQYADQTLSLGVINFLIKYHKITLDILNNFNHVPTLLHYSAYFSYNNLLEIVTDRPYIEYGIRFGNSSLLHAAAEQNNLRVVIELLKHQSYKKVINNQKPSFGNLLASAVFHGNIEMLNVLLANGAEVNGRYISPLDVAILTNKLDCFKVLLRAGADVNETTSEGCSSLITSTVKDKIEFIELILENGGDVNQIYDNNYTPLTLAANNGNLEAVNLILKYKPNINHQCESLGYTALHMASERDHVDVAKCLLENGASTKIKCNTLLTPLLVALINGSEQTAKVLIRADPSVVNECSSENLTPLIATAAKNIPDVIPMLVECGADVHSSKSNVSALHMAAFNQFDRCVIELLKAGASVNYPDEYGTTPLFATNSLTTTRILLDNGADINARSKSGDTALHFAASDGKVEIMEELVQRGADLSATNSAKQTPLDRAIAFNQFEATKCLLKYCTCVENDALCVAVRHDFLECIPFLIEKGVDVNAYDRFGLTPLCYAAMQNPSCIKILLENGADPNLCSDTQSSPLLFALWSGDSNAIIQLINAGADVQRHGSASSLHIVANLGDIFSLVLLVAHGADVHLKDKKGRTPLYHACGKVSSNELHYINRNREDCVSELLERGSPVNQKDNEGFTPLHVACQDKCVEVVKLLLQKGANVNDVNNKGQSPLHMCYLNETNSNQASCSESIDSKNTDIVKILVDHGVNVHLKDDQGRTAFFYACTRGDIDAVSLLESIGSNVNERDNEGSTPLHISCQDRFLEVLKLLLQQGADINAVNNKGQSALHLCFYEDKANLKQLHNPENGYATDIAIEKVLVDHGLNVDLRDHRGRTAVSYACARGDLDSVIFLHTSGADLFVENYEKDNLLAEASQYTTVLKYLVDNGVNVNHGNIDRITPLHRTVMSGNYDGTLYLIEQGADIDAVTVKDHATPIYVVALHGPAEIVALLLMFNANLSIRGALGNTPIVRSFKNLEITKLFASEFKDLKPDEVRNGITGDELREEWIQTFLVSAIEGCLEVLRFLHQNDLVRITDRHKDDAYTALHMTCVGGKYDTALYLVENGADVNAKDASGNTALYFAAEFGHLDIVKLLVEHGAEVEVSNNHGNTGLFTAAANGHFEIVEYLYDNGANINVIDEDGDTPLHDATSRGHFSVVKFLALRMVDIELRNKKNKTALDLAMDQGNQEIVDILMSQSTCTNNKMPS